MEYRLRHINRHADEAEERWESGHFELVSHYDALANTLRARYQAAAAYGVCARRDGGTLRQCEASQARSE